MNKKNILSVLTAAAITLGISGCSNNESSGDNSAYNSEFEYVTLAELPADIEAATKGSYKTFKVGDHISVNIPEKISEMHITGTSPSVELAQKIIDHYGLTNYATAKDDNDPHQRSLVNYDEEKTSLYIDKSGYLNYFSGLERKQFDQETDESYEDSGDSKTVYIDKRTDGQKIKCYGHELVLNELKKNAETAINDFQSVIGGFKCVPVYVSYDNYWSVVHCARVVNGYYRPFCEVSINLENITPDAEDFVGIHLMTKVFFQNNSDPVGVYDGWWETSAEYIGEEYEKMISMTSALKYLDSELAKYLDLDMDHACLIQLQKDHTVKMVEAGDYENEDFYNQYVNLDTHPFWQFLFHSQRSEDERYIAIIDCITGKFSFTKVGL